MTYNSDKLFESNILTGIAIPLSLLYGLGIKLRPSPRIFKVKCPVISVGNIHIGGTGKTPIVIAIAKALQRRGMKPAVVSRGYGGALSKTGVELNSSHKSQEVGDEPIEIFSELKNVSVIIGADRVSACRAAEKISNVIILDDGFQHRRVHRDINIVVYPANAKPKRQRLLPWGRLREPLSALKRAHAIVRVREIGEEENKPGTELKKYTDAQIFYGNRIIEGIEPYPGTVEPIALLGRDVVALSGIAQPKRFYNAVTATGANIVEIYEGRDHHRFSEKEIELVKVLSERHDAIVVMTQKDAARFDKRALPFPAAILKTGIDCPGLIDFCISRIL